MDDVSFCIDLYTYIGCKEIPPTLAFVDKTIQNRFFLEHGIVDIQVVESSESYRVVFNNTENKTLFMMKYL